MMNDSISIITAARGADEYDDATQDRSLVDQAKRFLAKRIEVPAPDLAQRLGAFLVTMDAVLAKLPAQLGEFELEELELSVEISAKGEVSLLGTGGEVSTTGGLTFTLRRQRPKPLQSKLEAAGAGA